MKNKLISIFILILLVLTYIKAFSIDKYIFSNGNNIPPYTNIYMAATSIEYLTNNLNDNDNIIICNDIIISNSINLTNNQIYIIGSNYNNSYNKIITIRGNIDPKKIITYRLFTAKNIYFKNIKFSELIVSNNLNPSIIRANYLELDNCIFNSNTIYLSYSMIGCYNLKISNSEFKNNYNIAKISGSVWFNIASNLYITNCVFENFNINYDDGDHIPKTEGLFNKGYSSFTNIYIYNSKFIRNYNYNSTIRFSGYMQNVIISNCIFNSNCAYSTAADIQMYNLILSNNAILRISDSSFSNKSSLYNTRARLYINGLTVVNNSTAIIERCIFKDSYDLDRSMIYGLNVNGLNIINSIMIGSRMAGGNIVNSAGALFFYGNNNKIINCTIANNNTTAYTRNSSYKRAGGLFIMGISNYVINCIVYSNICYNKINTNQVDNLLISPKESNYVYNTITTLLTNDNLNYFSIITNNPEIINFDSTIGYPLVGNYDYSLKETSICIDNGNTNLIFDYYDINKYLRTNIFDSKIDIGAYEFRYYPDRLKLKIILYSNKLILNNNTNIINIHSIIAK